MILEDHVLEDPEIYEFQIPEEFVVFLDSEQREKDFCYFTNNLSRDK